MSTNEQAELIRTVELDLCKIAFRKIQLLKSDMYNKTLNGASMLIEQTNCRPIVWLSGKFKDLQQSKNEVEVRLHSLVISESIDR